MLNKKLIRLLSGLGVLLIQIIFTGALWAGNIVINEFDLDPAGKDSGNEWIVLYNPSEVDIDISNWTLETTHGETVTVGISQDTIIPPKGYCTYIYKKQWLDNNDELIILKDANGVEIDKTLLASDTDNDNRYWARYPEGLDTNSDSDWQFRERVTLPSEFVPYSSFTYSPPEPATNQMITFDASSSDSLDPDAVIVSYKWNFGDGTVKMGKIVDHSYSSAGNYTVTLTVIDNDGKITRENIRTAKITVKKTR